MIGFAVAVLHFPGGLLVLLHLLLDLMFQARREPSGHFLNHLLRAFGRGGDLKLTQQIAKGLLRILPQFLASYLFHFDGVRSSRYAESLQG